MRDVRIEPKEGGKGRTFAATCLATVEADSLWEGGMSSTDDVRPVWAMFAAGEQELRPFMANLVQGRKVLLGEQRQSYRKKEDRMEFLRSAGYQVTWQREAEGAVVTVFLPDLFRLDPGMVDPKGATFVLLPPTSWSEHQGIDAEPIVNHVLSLDMCPLDKEALTALVPLSFLFSTYLDRRTRCPLVSDGRFYLQVLLASLRAGLASWSISDAASYRQLEFGQHSHFRFLEADTASVGLNRGVAFQATHEAIGEMLAEEVKVFFEATGGN